LTIALSAVTSCETSLCKTANLNDDSHWTHHSHILLYQVNWSCVNQFHLTAFTQVTIQ